MVTLRGRLIRLAYAWSDLRPHLLALVRQAGREWNQGQTYGEPLKYWEYRPGKKPPTNRGTENCSYKSGDPSKKCYEKRNLGPTRNKKKYNQKYREKVLKPKSQAKS